METARRTRKNRRQLLRSIWNCRLLYLMLIPVLAYYIIFKYIPMYGVTIAFKNYNIFREYLEVNGAVLTYSGKYSTVKISGALSETR